MKNLLSVLILLCITWLVSAQTYQPNWESLDKRATPQWWTDAKFGIFIHWGVYSVPAYAPTNEANVYMNYGAVYEHRLLQGNKKFVEHHNRYFGEDFTYADFAPMFKAEYFNPDYWAELFKEAGARYVVLVTKHSDGFCLWPSQYAPRWNSVDVGPHRDLVGELTKSVKDKGLHMGFYYILLEWSNHPLYKKETIGRWVDELMIPQMKELITRYHPETLFADGEWDYDSKTLKSEEFLAWLYNESPVKSTIVVNDRWGKETRSKHGGYYTTEYNLIHDKEGIGDAADHPWEESRGIGGSYCHNRFETLEHYSTSKQLIDLLIATVSNGGNLLLNVGPDSYGLIPVIMQERILDMGKWLKINGEAIYGTSTWRGSKASAENVYYTRKENDLYIICTRWPDKSLVLSDIPKCKSLSLLGSDKKINHTFANRRLTIDVSNILPNDLPCEHAWVFKVRE